jgi:hypothetical protein
MRPRTTQRPSWDSKAMQEAVDAVRAGNFTPSATHFGVPRTTLRTQLRYDALRKGMGRKQDIPPEIEQDLVHHILLMESRGSGLSIDEVETLAYRFATKKVRVSEGKAGKTWFYGFKERHPEFSVRRPGTLSLTRARGMNKNDVNLFF